jgi:HprK-related kinase A
MLTVASLSPGEFAERLAAQGVGVRFGPFDARIRSQIPALAEPLWHLYTEYELLPDSDRVFSLHVNLQHKWRLRPRPARMVRFTVDGVQTHDDVPAGQALAALEWGLNFVVAMRYNCYLMLHSAVVERNGQALLMPASPGFGKTTLCAALVHRGWRLFSDEFGLVRPGTRSFLPVPRPMPLKNESIGVLRRFAPEACLGPEIPGTRKGTIAHVRPPRDSVVRAGDPAEAGWIVFPRWVAGAPLALQEMPRSAGFMQLAMNAFNYEKLGAAGFETLQGLVGNCRCFSLAYSDLAEAVQALTRLADDHVA